MAAIGDLSSPSTAPTTVTGLNAIAAAAADSGHKDLAMESHLKAAEVAVQAPETALPPQKLQAIKDSTESATKFFAAVGDDAKASSAAQQLGKLRAMAERVKQ